MGVNFHSRVSQAHRTGPADEKRARNGGTRSQRNVKLFLDQRLAEFFFFFYYTWSRSFFFLC